MDVTLAVLCDDAHERPDGKLDLVGVFNELRAPGFPAVQDRMTVVFILAWTPEEAGRRPLRADLVDEAGEMLLTIQGHTEVPAADTSASRPVTRLIMPLERVVFPRAGHYHFRIVAGAHPQRACSLYVGELAA
jgi:hypothetical protein